MRNLLELDQWVPVSHETDGGETIGFPAWFRVENGQYMSLAVRTETVEKAVIWATIFEADENDQMPADPTEWEGGSAYSLGSLEDFEEFMFWAPAGGVMLTSYNPVVPIPEDTMVLRVYTAQGASWVQPPVEGESFARVMDRAPRNEEFDKMMHSVMYNVERRLAETKDEHGRTLAQINARHAAELEAIRAERESSAGGGAAGDEPPAAGGASDESAGAPKGGKSKSNDVA